MLKVSKAPGGEAAGVAYASSTRLDASWSAPPVAVDHVRLSAAEKDGPHHFTLDLPGSTVAFTVVGLEAGTSYDLSLAACVDAACTQRFDGGAPANASTEEERWIFRGSGGSVQGLAKVVFDGNTKAHAFRYGPGAGPELEGRVQLYYDPITKQEKGVKMALLAAPAAPTPESVSAFMPIPFGLRQPLSAAPLVGGVRTAQAVPLAASLGGGVRLYFEAEGQDKKTRVLSLDSQDGWVGQDFNAGPSKVCGTMADYSPGGGCAPAVVLGVEGDAVSPSPGVSAARQFKIAYPDLDDFRWDGAPGTFMLVTIDAKACSSSSRTVGYAVWDGLAWGLRYEGACPKLFVDMQAPSPMHLGGLRYKLYYADTNPPHGAPGMIPAPGPKKLLYADGARTGDASRVDFEDWEPEERAREVHYLFPSGAELDEDQESYLDDFVVLAPTGDLGFQVIYTAVSDGKQPPFLAMATLVNP
jgi:hypothetical protein